jgi:O-antigen ligase
LNTAVIQQPYKNKIIYLQLFLIAFGLLGFELFSYLPELLKVDSRIVTVPYRALYLVLCTAVLISARQRNTIKVHIDFIPILTFWFFYYIRASFDTIFKLDEIKMPILDFWLFAFFLSFYPMLPLLCKVNLKTIIATKYLVFSMAVILNILAIIYNYGKFSIGNISRIQGNEILNTITSGQIAATLIVMCFTFFNNRKIWVLLSLSALIIIGLINIVIAASRGPVIQLLIILLVFVSCNLRRIGYKNLLFIFVIFTCLGIYFSDFITTYNLLMSRLEGTGLSQSGSDNLRYQMFTGAWDQFTSHPILGDFIEGRAFGGYPHNIFLESLMSMGIFGGVTMIIIFIVASINSLTLMKHRSTDWVGCLLIMQMVAQFTSGSIYSSFAFWSLIALTSTLKNNFVLYHNV